VIQQSLSIVSAASGVFKHGAVLAAGTVPITCFDGVQFSKVVAATAAQLTTISTPCRGVLLLPQHVDDTAATNAGAVFVGTKGRQYVAVEPTNYEGVWYPCTDVSQVYVRGTASDVIRAVVVG
jgi:hypothetical protein